MFPCEMSEQTVIGGTLAEVVRDIWAAFERHGLDEMLSRVPEDVEWCPVAGDGRVFRGSSEVRAFWASEESAGKRERAVPHRFEQDGETVLVSGSLRQFAPHGWADSQPLWVFFFRDGRLRRAEGFRTREDAMAAVAAHNAAA